MRDGRIVITLPVDGEAKVIWVCGNEMDQDDVNRLRHELDVAVQELLAAHAFAQAHTR